MTLLNIALYAMALKSRSTTTAEYRLRLVNAMPWLMLPDVIEVFIPQRSVTHFQGNAWIEYPIGEVLSELNSKVIANKAIKFDVGEEETDFRMHIDAFDKHNYAHHNFEQIRLHLMQDSLIRSHILDRLVDVDERADNSFVLKCDENVIFDESDFEREVMKFEETAFLHLLGKNFKKTGVLIDSKWIEKNVLDVLLDSYYSSDLMKYSAKLVRLSSQVEWKIRQYDFDVTQYKEVFGITGDALKDCLDELLSLVFLETRREVF